MSVEQVARSRDDPVWPDLPYASWRPTLETVHMWMQVVGKVKLALTPFLSEWWNVTFSLTPRGISSGMIPSGQRTFDVDFDFVDHRLTIHLCDGRASSMPLRSRSVADFYRELMSMLAAFGIAVTINTRPVEVDHTLRFEADEVHRHYVPADVNRFWRVLLSVSRVMERYRTPFVGKSSPVQFWWGSFDLATTRFSGRPAPPREWPTRWMALSAQQEYALAGFWPGNQRFPEPAFVAYTYPEPPGCRTAAGLPADAFFHLELAEFILPYARVRTAPNPDQLVLDFYRGAYAIGATLAGWDRAALERDDLTNS